VKKYSFFLLLSTALTFAQMVLTSIPSDFQFFSCDDNQDSAIVIVEGRVTILGTDSISVTLLKDGIFLQRLVQPVMTNNSDFSFSPKIHAELASYKLELRLGNELVYSADSLICGDAYMIDGQSNAEFSNQTYATPWLRTFNPDSTWSNPNESAWGIGQHLIENQKIPICIFNGAVSGTPIELHQRDTSRYSIYGNLYWRITRSGLKNHIRAILWHQGESNSDDSVNASIGYNSLFTAMVNGWRSDYPGFEHIYVFQIHPGCGGKWQHLMRETQRNLHYKFQNLSIMSTVGVIGHDGCHYSNAGYLQMGDWMYRLMARDLYGSSDTIGITPPNIKEAYFKDTTHTRITLRFDQPVVLPDDPSIKKYFYLDEMGDIAESIFSDTAGCALTLVLKAKSNARNVGYIPSVYYPGTYTIYNGPWLFNRRGVGALTFYNLPIQASPLLSEDNGVPQQTVSKANTVISVLPNPFNPHLEIQINCDSREGLLTVFHLDGRVAVDFTKELKSGLRRIVWNTSDCGSGIYIIRLKQKGKEWTIKAVLLR
jgi:hypothetical protein